ncbi:transketolase [Phototrophicus methaneseepsis]|uniref:Transketolase n=1 Tax=Phototrophicus methaneseepsis TaxID=2710758 RepID=A0A7S8ECJ5_9CHLR|nr:transketolase [Phototrophicus methaneseepsis]QPC84429.1 transketolase [Phototrophicus methaneseepsis]
MSTAVQSDLKERAINTIRTLSIDAVQKANSGHPGLPLGAAPMAYVLWTKYLHHNPTNPTWINRDRFILSAGHGSMLLYSLLHLTGYDLPLDELKNFRQWGSKTPGHPEVHYTPGVETTTGPLGQGVGNAVGMALAEAFLANYFNRDGHTIIDHHTYAIVSDGDLMEGVAMEACALAGHWGLGKLIFLYDDNDITLDGEASMIFTDDVLKRFESQGWHTQRVHDGNDIVAIDEAITNARNETNRPSIISVKTIIGYGSPNKSGTSSAHGSPLGAEEVKLTKEALGWPTDEAFYIPGDVLEHFRSAIEEGTSQEAAWNKELEAYKAAFPDMAQIFDDAFAGRLPEGWDSEMPTFDPNKAQATRNANGAALNAIAKHVPTMIGGDADLAGSTKTLIKGEDNTGHLKPTARNLRFGVREHAMGSITNGLALHGGIIKPYTATFLTFSDYMRPAIRLGALMSAPALYIFTHDSIGVGEDGPTHEPVEHVMSLRLIPQLYVFRPGDAYESAAAWKTAMELNGPATLIFSRQDVPVLDGDNVEGIYEGVARGAYVLAETEELVDGLPEVILMATGTELSIALEAYENLEEAGVSARVVSMPCWELFEEQPQEYIDAVLPPEVTTRVSIEAGVTTGWQKWIGLDGIAIGVDRFGASAPYAKIYEEYGLTARAVVEAVSQLLDAEEDEED